jgi:hypothetical protein
MATTAPGLASSLIERSKASLQLWNLVTPCAAPDLKQFAIWAYRFTDALMERAILKASRKFSGTDDPETVHRYVTGLLLNLQQEQNTKGAA